MLSIEKSDQFKNELADWNTKLLLVSDKTTKKELEQLINSLIQQVRLLDSCHNDLGITNRISTNTLEFRENILNTRRIIYKKFQEVGQLE